MKKYQFHQGKNINLKFFQVGNTLTYLGKLILEYLHTYRRNQVDEIKNLINPREMAHFYWQNLI